MNEFQPISSAPKNGDDVLLYVHARLGNCYVIGHWMPGGHCIEDHPPIEQGWYWWNGYCFDLLQAPMAWAKLPKAPDFSGEAPKGP